ncbi:SMI1/KNR4 family protein [Planctomicrobium piriforme]|uniref:SMI1/KNR4 family protein n=1 Tax=Planctomicrobium piriforme TaxID=1576369 RepID=UPI000B88BA7C|nr:SMI1/KNR4 family protein [Planctomicrobium piriforme]
MPFPLSEQFVKEAEAKLGMRFPSEYVAKMMKANGGEFQTQSDEWELYPILDSSDKKRLARTFNDVVRETLAARNAYGFPPDAVAIGANGCGDHLVLLPQQDSAAFLGNAIYWWDHETGEMNLISNQLGEVF